jgi:hypothetical protein
MNSRYYTIDPNSLLYTSFDDDTLLNIVINNSNRDSELKRTPNVSLCIRPFKCSELEQDNECSICQDKFRIHEKISKLHVCGHMYHYSCVSEWAKYKPYCPLCRKKIPILER